MIRQGASTKTGKYLLHRQVVKYLGCVAVLAALLAAQVLAPGAAFPSLKGQDLDDHEVVLPDAASGKVSVIILAFSKAAGERSHVWQEHLVKDYPDEKLVASYSVALLGDAPAFLRGIIRSGIRKGTPQPMHHRTIIVESESKPWKERVAMINDKLPYLLLLDAKGRLVWSCNGEFADKQYSELRAKIGEMAQK